MSSRAVVRWFAILAAGPGLACVEPQVHALVFDQASPATVEAGTSHNFSVTMDATEPTPRDVEWDATCGNVMGGLRRVTYVAPDAPGSCEVTATSLFDRTKVARLTVEVVRGSGGGAVRWTRQFGSAAHDWIRRLAVDGEGNVYALGETQGDLDGAALGDTDLFLRKYDADGTLVWARHFGSTTREFTNGLAVDAAGAVYVAGTTYGSLDDVNAGGSDAFVRKYDADGSIVWTRQWGTTADDTAQGVAVDAEGHVWVAGWTMGVLQATSAGGPDAFVRLLDGDGEAAWTRQFGSAENDFAIAIASDGDGGAVVAVNTAGAITGASHGGLDHVLRRFDALGQATWTRQQGAAGDDRIYGLATRAGGGVVVAGAAGPKGFVQALDLDGDTLWTDELGGEGETLAQDVATNAAGEVLVVGMTDGAVSGENLGFFDGFVRAYTASGSTRWSRQPGTAADDYAWGAALANDGSAYVGGRTDGVFVAPWNGGSDAFLRALAP